MPLFCILDPLFSILSVLIFISGVKHFFIIGFPLGYVAVYHICSTNIPSYFRVLPLWLLALFVVMVIGQIKGSVIASNNKQAKKR
jgi:hypothetical protein